MSQRFERRHFFRLSVGGILVAAPALASALGCVREGREAPAPRDGAIPDPTAGGKQSPYGPSASNAPPATPKCAGATETNIEGPYYRGGAPFRSNLVEDGMSGRVLKLEGRIVSLDCRSPLSGATLDVWQADGDGHYDNDGSLAVAPERFRLRGKVRADDKGRFAVRTVVPGRYLNGRTYRPAHIHVKLAAPGHAPLTTQLYFPGDPYNDADPFIRRSLIMDVSGDVASYDFVLTPA